MAKSWKSNLKQ